MLIFSVIVATLIKKSKATYWHRLTRKVGKECFPNAKQVKKHPTTTLYKIYTNVKNEGKQVNESFDFPPDIENTFSTSYFNEDPILYVLDIENLIE